MENNSENTIQERKKIFEQMRKSVMELDEKTQEKEPEFTIPEFDTTEEFGINEFGEIERPKSK